MVHESCSIQSRKQVLQGVVQNGRFLQTEKRKDKEIIGKRKKLLQFSSLPSFAGREGQ